MVNWVMVAIIWFVLASIIYLIIRSAQKESQKLKEEKHRPEPIFKTKIIK